MRKTTSSIGMFLIAFFLICSLQVIHGLDNGLALKPPMGWIAWERFTCQTDCALYPEDCINSHLFESTADALVANGFKEAGYEYVNIDDCWSEKSRDPTSMELVPDRKRFPFGIDKLAAYIHSKGLKFGIYGDCGTQTCAGYPAQLKPNSSDFQDNFFQLDANILASWQVDSFKFDGCNIDPLKAESICPKMAQALKSTGKPILLTCEWPFYLWRNHPEGPDPDFALAAESCNLWRYYEDVEDSWSKIIRIIDFTIKHQEEIIQYHGPGHWFDPDQLVIGNFGLSLDQAQAQMAIWSVWAAPLFMGNDVRSIDGNYGDVLKNKHLIGVDQDELGVFGLMVEELDDGYSQIFIKPTLPINNHCPSFAIVFLNRHTIGNKIRIATDLQELLLKAPIEVAAKHQAKLIESGLYSGKSPSSKELINTYECRKHLELAKGISFNVTDLFTGTRDNIALKSGVQLEVTVPPSGVQAVSLEMAPLRSSRSRYNKKN